MANFSYELALKMDRELVIAHVKTASPSSVSQALRRYRDEGRTDIVTLIEDARQAVRIQKITATIRSKQAA